MPDLTDYCRWPILEMPWIYINEILRTITIVSSRILKGGETKTLVVAFPREANNG